MATDETKQNSLPVWQMTAFADYSLPPAPARETAVKGLAALWRLIRNRNQSQQEPEKSDDQLKDFSDEELDRMVPAVDWTPGAAALDARLSHGLDPQHPPIRFVIGPPFGGHASILTAWATLRQSPVIAPPTSEQILARDKEWFSAWPIHDQPWVLPDLEHCFLRHADGLAVVRRFFEQALAGRLGIGLVGCDSWAWRYLQKVWEAPLADALTLQAFDHERLRLYLNTLLDSNAVQPLCFREVNSGRDVLGTSASETADAASSSSFLKHLAAHSRGNLGVARDYWRASLCAGPDDAEESDSAKEAPTDTDLCRTIWLRTGLKEPELPIEPTREIAFVLHALLLHNGLPADLLAALLPLPRDTVTATLLRLVYDRLVEANGHGWRVSALGYPVIRRFLKNNGYLVDGF